MHLLYKQVFHVYPYLELVNKTKLKKGEKSRACIRTKLMRELLGKTLCKSISSQSKKCLDLDLVFKSLRY